MLNYWFWLNFVIKVKFQFNGNKPFVWYILIKLYFKPTKDVLDSFGKNVYITDIQLMQ